MPARKKKKQPAKDKLDAIKAVRKDSFEKNELVFALVPGHPHWPAKIESFNEESNDYFVLFFGTFEKANVSVKNLFPFEENYGKYKTPSRKIAPKKMKLFEKSVADCMKFKAGGCEDYFQELLSELDEIQTSDLSQNEPVKDYETDSDGAKNFHLWFTRPMMKDKVERKPVKSARGRPRSNSSVRSVKSASSGTNRPSTSRKLKPGLREQNPNLLKKRPLKRPNESSTSLPAKRLRTDNSPSALLFERRHAALKDQMDSGSSEGIYRALGKIKSLDFTQAASIGVAEPIASLLVDLRKDTRRREVMKECSRVHEKMKGELVEKFGIDRYNFMLE